MESEFAGGSDQLIRPQLVLFNQLEPKQVIAHYIISIQSSLFAIAKRFAVRNAFLALVFLAVTTAGPVQGRGKAALKPTLFDCPTPKGWAEVAREKPRFVVFGELHGTEQSPRFVADLACSLSNQGKPVLMAIEHEARIQPALEAAWQLPSGKFELALAKLGWTNRNDGRHSQAMFDLIVRLHLLKERGLPVSITAFNGPKDEVQARKFADLSGQGPHEARQAENIAEAASALMPYVTLVLVGNFHAARTPIERQGTKYDPMAKRLASYGKVISLNMSYGAGTAWNCQLSPSFKPISGQPIPPEQIKCGAFPTDGTTDLAVAPFIRLFPKDNGIRANDYDGDFWVGPASASPPKFR